MCSLWECFGYSKEKRKNTGTYFKTTKNRSQQTSSYEGYLYNDCHESLSKKIFELVEIVDPEPKTTVY